MISERSKLLVGISALCMVSCSFPAPVDSLAIRSPGSWASVSTGDNEQISTGWLRSFRDPTLTRNVERALANNQSLKVAATRLRAAEEDTIIARARRLPQVSADTRSSLSDGPQEARRQSYGLNLAASWEPDLWGRLRDLSAAAQADEKAALEDFRAARLSLAANAAKSYIDLISARQEVDLASFTLESFEKVLRIIERNYKATGEGALDIQFGRTNVASAQRALEARKLEMEDAARALEVLQGRYPSGATKTGLKLPDLPSRIPVGIPSAMIERRPDLAATRAAIFASARRTDAVRKGLLPDLSLSSGGGVAGPRLSDLLNVDFLIGRITANIDQLIFDGGETEAQVRRSLAGNERFVHQYAQEALEAFSEVEATLAADQSLGRQEKFLREEVAQASLAERQAERNYAEGINGNILSVLEAQRRAQNARASIIRLKNRRLQNRIDLHLALGGDYSTTGK